jgi:hypothetical protein
VAGGSTSLAAPAATKASATRILSTSARSIMAAG